MISSLWYFLQGLHGCTYSLNANIREIKEIGWLRSGSSICQSRVWLQIKIDDTKTSYQVIITISIAEKNEMYSSEKGLIIQSLNAEALQSLRNTNWQAPETVSYNYCRKSLALDSRMVRPLFSILWTKCPMTSFQIY